MDFSNSVILPREDFVELQEAAWSNDPQPTAERIASVAQTFTVFAIVTGAVLAMSWGYHAAADWRERKAFERRLKQARPRNAE